MSLPRPMRLSCVCGIIIIVIPATPSTCKSPALTHLSPPPPPPPPPTPTCPLSSARWFALAGSNMHPVHRAEYQRATYQKKIIRVRLWIDADSDNRLMVVDQQLQSFQFNLNIRFAPFHQVEIWSVSHLKEMKLGSPLLLLFYVLFYVLKESERGLTWMGFPILSVCVCV